MSPSDECAPPALPSASMAHESRLTSTSQPIPVDPTRRRLLTGLAALAAASGTGLLASCGKNSPETASPAATIRAPDAGGRRLGARFADGYVAPTALVAETPQRAPYVLLDSDGWPMVDGAPDSMELTLRALGSDGDPGEVITSATVTRHGFGQATPYYPFRFTAPEPGDYVVDGSIDGVPLADVHYLRLATPTDLDLVQVGDLLPIVATPTITEPLGVDPICTSPNGPCDFHGLSLDQAAARHGPTALLVSTPGFCQQDVCSPTIGLLADAVKNRQGQEAWSVVHAEVYVAPEVGDFTLSPVGDALGLNFEPSLLVADATGTVTAVIHFTMDAIEVAEALASAT